MTDQTPATHPYPCNDAIMQNRREAFVDGYRQCFADFQAWAGEQSGVPVDYITEKMRENVDRYEALMLNAPALDKALAEVKAGRTVDLGDFSMYLEDPCD